MKFFKTAKKKALLVTAQQVAKFDGEAFDELISNEPILQDCFWEFVLDIDNLMKWKDSAINSLLRHTTQEGFAKIAFKPKLQEKLDKNYLKIVSKFPMLIGKLAHSQSAPLSHSSSTRSHAHTSNVNIHIDAQPRNHALSAILITAAALAVLLLLVKFIIAAIVVVGLGVAAGLITQQALQESNAPSYGF